MPFHYDLQSCQLACSSSSMEPPDVVLAVSFCCATVDELPASSDREEGLGLGAVL